MGQRVNRVCNLCEAMCGLVIERGDGKDMRIRGNRDDVFSKGAFCPKSQGLKDLLFDPDRVRKPLKRVSGQYVSMSWEEAFGDISHKINEIQKKYGTDAVAVYSGNPNTHHFGNLLILPLFLASLRTPNKYSATSVDQLPHMLVSYLMFGHQLLLPIPDVDRTRSIIMFGANPAVSNGSILSAPGLSSRLKALAQKGGKVFLFDPRYTETASIATHHYFIKPGTDAFLLAAILHRLIKKGGLRLGRLGGMVKNLDPVLGLFTSFDIQSVEQITGVSSAAIDEVLEELLHDKPAIVYGRLGVSAQKYGLLCQWMIYLLNIFTGNLDREGGVLFTKPAFDIINLATKIGSRGSFRRRYSRVHHLPEFAGELPVATLADEILTPGKGQIKALITVAGNPVLTTPEGRRLESALKNLELMVSIDIYQNETTGLANYILPSTTPLERSHFDLVFNALSSRNIVRYSPPVVEPPTHSLADWQILLELWSRIGIHDSLWTRIKKGSIKRFLFATGLEPLLDLGLRFGPYRKEGMSLKKVKKNENGIDLGPLKPRLPAILATLDKKIDLLPKPIEEAWNLFREDQMWHVGAISKKQSEHSEDLLLIGRRHLKSNNSWMHNLTSLNLKKDPCFVMMHPQDAQNRNIQGGTLVKVTTAVGSLELPVHISEHIMPGVISIPHGYGHNRPHASLSLAEKAPGKSINDIMDATQLDQVAGTAILNGQKVKVTAM